MRALSRAHPGETIVAMRKLLNTRLRMLRACRLSPFQPGPALNNDLLNISKVHAGDYFTAAEMLPILLDGLVQDSPHVVTAVVASFLCAPSSHSHA